MSWWKHFEAEVGNLADLGFTQVWLPPPNKAMVPVRLFKIYPHSFKVNALDRKDKVMTLMIWYA